MFTGWVWDRPAAGRPGPWLDVAGPLGLCTNGVHACRPGQLPPWLGPELWVVELAGEIVDAGLATVASRARLVEPVGTWDEAARMRFAEDCTRRARRTAGDDADRLTVVAFMETMAAAGQAAACGYWAASLAGEAVAGERRGSVFDEAFAVERSRQAEWLTAHLGLAA